MSCQSELLYYTITGAGARYTLHYHICTDRPKDPVNGAVDPPSHLSCQRMRAGSNQMT